MCTLIVALPSPQGLAVLAQDRARCPSNIAVVVREALGECTEVRHGGLKYGPEIGEAEAGTKPKRLL